MTCECGHDFFTHRAINEPPAGRVADCTACGCDEFVDDENMEIALRVLDIVADLFLDRDRG